LESAAEGFRRFPNTLGVTALIGMLLGCGETGPEDPTLTGSWFGVESSGEAATNWSADLSESSTGAITGTFSLQWESLSATGTVSGTHSFPQVNLMLLWTFYGESITGSFFGNLVTADLLRGTITIAEDPPFTLDLERVR